MTPDDPATALQRHLMARRKQVFKWGETDCALFAADIIEVLTGVDPAARFRGRYSTERGAWRVLKSEGFDSLQALADSVLSRLPDEQRAQRGDILLMRGPVVDGVRRDFFAVCVGAYAVGPSALRGVDHVGLDLRLAAWTLREGVKCLR